MAREKRPPFDRPFPIDTPSTPAPEMPISLPLKRPREVSITPPRMEPNDWINTTCGDCKRGWQDILYLYGTEEHKLLAKTYTRRNVDMAVMRVLAYHRCPERVQREKREEDRASEWEAKRVAKEEEQMVRDDEDKKAGKRRSRRVKKKKTMGEKDVGKQDGGDEA